MSRRGMNGRSVAALGNNMGTPALVTSVTCTGSDTEYIFASAPYNLRVLRCWGTMLTAGTSSDTCRLQRVRQGTTNHITDSADLSALADTDSFEFSQYDNDYWTINKGDTLQVVTANGAAATDTVQVTVMYARVEG